MATKRSCPHDNNREIKTNAPPDVRTESDLMPEGAAPGTVPTDIEQATGLERLEILGKMEGIDVFDMKPLPSDRMGTLKEPVIVRSFGDEQYCGCTGIPADTHHVKWLTVSHNLSINLDRRRNDGARKERKHK
jgi:cytochrome c oxidase subunit 5b